MQLHTARSSTSLLGRPLIATTPLAISLPLLVLALPVALAAATPLPVVLALLGLHQLGHRVPPELLLLLAREHSRLDLGARQHQLALPLLGGLGERLGRLVRLHEAQVGLWLALAICRGKNRNALDCFFSLAGKVLHFWLGNFLTGKIFLL